MAIQINWEKIKLYAVSIIIPLALGGITGLITSGAMDYEMLDQPPLSPPSFLFPVVWTILYALMGLSFAIVKDKGLADNSVTWVYYVQLFVNLLWPVIFFNLKWRLLAFVWIVILDVLVAVMVSRFYGKDKTAGLILLPYLVWVLFASYLNLGVYLLNM